MSEEAVIVRRFIPVARQKVFDAWLDASTMPLWMCPGNVAHTTAELDPRVGGKFRIVMSHGRGDSEHTGEYVEIVRPSRLSFTWISAATQFQPTLVTVELFERDGGTEIVLTHHRLPPPKMDEHREGWTDIVRKLGTFLAPE